MAHQLPLIIIPAKNEEATIGAVIGKIAACAVGRIVVVDDCSTDRTIEFARAAGALVLPLALPLGAWGAIQTGLRYALAEGYEAVVTMDGDGQHCPQTIRPLLQRLAESGVEVVVAADPQRLNWRRLLAWRLLRLITGLKVADLTSGYRAYSRTAFSLLASLDATLLDYQDVGVLLLLRTRGLGIVEIPTVMGARTAGRSRIFDSWLAVARYLAQSILLSFCRRK